jgi:hypothetical protein
MDRVFVGILISVILGMAGFGYFKKLEFEKRIETLHQEINEHVNTIQINEHVWMKSTKEVEDLKNLLDESKREQKLLKDALNANKSEVLSLTQLNIKLKKGYEEVIKNAKQTEIVENKVPRTKVEFDKDFGAYKVSGYTLTNPGEAKLKLSQIKPLKLTIALSKQNNKWQTHVASSDEDVALDINVNSLDQELLERKWYEKFGVATQISGGTLLNRGGALFGVGLTYDVWKLSIGPNFVISNYKDKLYGINVIYKPFQK